MNGHLSLLEKGYNKVKLQYSKQFVEEILIQRAVETTIQIFFLIRGYLIVFLMEIGF